MNKDQFAYLNETIISLESENERLRGALEEIVTVKLDPELGQIVGSEHYEGAWLDCVEIARAALEGKCS